MLKYYNGSVYIFAGIGLKQTTGNKTFTLPSGVTGTTATVVAESRTIPITGGAFTDNFAAEYTHHVYQIAAPSVINDQRRINQARYQPLVVCPGPAGWLVQMNGMDIRTPVTIRDIRGQAVCTALPDNNRFIRLPAENIPGGVYFVQVPGQTGAWPIVLVR